MTGLALKHMLENSFSEAEGARPATRNVPRIGLVFTDGRSQDDITEYAKKAKEAGEPFRTQTGRPGSEQVSVDVRVRAQVSPCTPWVLAKPWRTNFVRLHQIRWRNISTTPPTSPPSAPSQRT